MKSRILSLLGVLIFCGHVAAQQLIYNITTGYDQIGSTLIAPGNSDDDWVLVQAPDPNNSTGVLYPNIPAPVTNGSLWDIYTGNTDYTSWGTPPNCGRHICPHVTGAGSGWYWETPTTAGREYIYRLTFTGPDCAVNPRFNISNFGVDDFISLKLNGTPYNVTTVSVPITNLVLGGTNILEAVISNPQAATGFYLCGKIESSPPPITPVLTNASSFCQGDPLTFNGSGSTGAITSHFWEIASCDQWGNYTGQVWNSWFTGAPSSISFGHFIGFIPACGKYYRIKLAVSNNCIDWVETTNIIFIKCPPKVVAVDPEPICEGSAITLNVSGDAHYYEWDPGNIIGNSLLVSPGTTTTYTVTGYGTNGCSMSVPVTVTVAPYLLDINLSTGVDNTTGNLISYGSNDDTWKVRGIPGTIYTAANSALTWTKVASPLAGTWTSSSNANWITIPQGISGSGVPVEVAATHTDNTPSYDNWYYFETEFNLPPNYANLRFELNETAVDNDYILYLNSQVLSGSPNNFEYVLAGGGPTNFNSLHTPGTIATNQSHYQVGTNTVLASIQNGGSNTGFNGSYLGLLANLHVKGECFEPDGRSVIIAPEELSFERIDASTLVYPNPSAGSFTISCQDELIQKIVIRDVLGKVVKEINEAAAPSVNVSLDDAKQGLYFAEITYVGKNKPVFRKLIRN
jgi:hypothetical protein